MDCAEKDITGVFIYFIYLLLLLLFFFFFAFSRATPRAYGGSQARGLIGAVTSSLRQSHGNVGSKPCL